MSVNHMGHRLSDYIMAMCSKTNGILMDIMGFKNIGGLEIVLTEARSVAPSIVIFFILRKKMF